MQVYFRISDEKPYRKRGDILCYIRTEKSLSKKYGQPEYEVPDNKTERAGTCREDRDTG